MMKPGLPTGPDGRPEHPIKADHLKPVIEKFRVESRPFKMGMVSPVSEGLARQHVRTIELAIDHPVEQRLVASSSTSIASRPFLVIRSAIAPVSSSRRQTGSVPHARTSSSRPARMSLSTIFRAHWRGTSRIKPSSPSRIPAYSRSCASAPTI
jgi:hypothetical protein